MMRETIWAVLVRACDELGGVQWRWRVADHVLGRSHGGYGSKIHLVCYGQACRWP